MNMANGDYELEYSRWWLHTDGRVIVKKLQAMMHGTSTSHCGLDRIYWTLVLKRGGKIVVKEGH